jgi:hypothetical protein
MRAQAQKRAREGVKRVSWAKNAPGSFIGAFDEASAVLDPQKISGKCLRRHYYDDDQVSQSWLVEARKAVTSTTGRPGAP